MNPVIEAILTRRSTRAFTDKPLTRDEMETLINAGRYAPSGMNRQTWHFTGILNQEKIHELATCISTVLDRKDYNFYNAPALILVSNEKEGRWSRDDNACALQNILLAAHSMGIASVWVNQLKGICDDPRVRPLLTHMEIPENHEIYGLAALGYDAGEPKGMVEKTGAYTIIE